MYNDSFKKRYRDIPIAIYQENSSKATRRHLHREIELLAFDTGATRVSVGDAELTARSGDLVIVNSMEPHALSPKEGAHSHRCICFDPSLIAHAALRQGLECGLFSLPHHLIASDPLTGQLRPLFDRLFHSIQSADTAATLEGTAYLSLLLAALQRAGSITERGGKRETRFYQTTLTLIATRYMEPLTSADAANALFYTQSHFCRVFKQAFGLPFAIYLNLYRISCAKALLRDRTDSIASIAASCGFPDPVYFTKCFKQHCGLLPHEYRNINTVL